MKTCINHHDREAFSICHGCKKDYCRSCLDEGKEYYYCKDPECQKILALESTGFLLPEIIVCPNCKSELELNEREQASGKVHCGECEALIENIDGELKANLKDNYQEVIRSLNQGDIAVIKSIFDDAGIDYYILGENFLGVRPLLEPARIFVNSDQIEEVKELLKDFDLKIFGASARQDD